VWENPLWVVPGTVRLWPMLTAEDGRQLKQKTGYFVGALVAIAAEVRTGADILVLVGLLVTSYYLLDELYGTVEQLQKAACPR
jgi:hypothetical protein